MQQRSCYSIFVFLCVFKRLKLFVCFTEIIIITFLLYPPYSCILKSLKQNFELKVTHKSIIKKKIKVKKEKSVEKEKAQCIEMHIRRKYFGFGWGNFVICFFHSSVAFPPLKMRNTILCARKHTFLSFVRPFFIFERDPSPPSHFN